MNRGGCASNINGILEFDFFFSIFFVVAGFFEIRNPTVGIPISTKWGDGLTEAVLRCISNEFIHHFLFWFISALDR